MNAGVPLKSLWLAVTLAGATGQDIVGIQIEGLQRTSRELVLNQMASKIGAPDSEVNRRLDLLYLDRLGIFSSIRIDPEPVPEGVLLRVTVKETFPIAPYPSVTTTQENGLAVGPGLGAVNLFGRAYHANVAAEFGGSTNFYAQLVSPQLSHTPWSYSLSFSRAQRDNPVFRFKEDSVTAEANLRYQFRPDLLLSSSVALLSLRSEQPGVTLDPSGHDSIPSLSVGLRYDTRDSWSNPIHGWFLEATVFRHALGSSPPGWWTGQLDARRYQRIAGRHTAAAFSLLSLQTGQPGVDLPNYMTYGIGGANTVRGWPVGARQGKHQWLNSLEYRYQWVKPRPIRLFGKFNLYWGLHFAVYGDLGTAWTETPDFSRNFIGSVGYGIRLVIPYVGVIRFDRAYGSGLRPAWGIGERADLWLDRIR